MYRAEGGLCIGFEGAVYRVEGAVYRVEGGCVQG